MDKTHQRKLNVLAAMHAVCGFTYYGFVSIITLFLIEQFKLPTTQAYQMYGLLLAFSYITPLISGFIADKFLDNESLLLTNLLCITAGWAIASFGHQSQFLIGMSLALFGMGSLKTCSNGLLAQAFDDKSPTERDKAFSILYAALNAGAIIAPLALGLFANHADWHIAFLANSVIGFLGFIIFANRYQHRFTAKGFVLALVTSIMIATIAGLFLLHTIVFEIFLVVLILCICTYAGQYILRHYRTQFPQILYLLFLYVMIAVFFSAEFQVGGALTVFIHSHMRIHIGAFHIPTSSYALLLPLFVALGIFACLPLIKRLEKLPIIARGTYRVIIGVGLCAMAFYILSAFVNIHAATLNPLWPLIGIVLGYLAMGLGEIIFAPATTAATAALAPKALRTTFMGILYLFSALAGWLASFWSKMTIVTAQGKTDFHHTFLLIAITLTTISALILIVYQLSAYLYQKWRA